LTDEQLIGLAHAVGNMVKNEVRNTGVCRGVIASIHDGQLHRMRKVEKEIIEHCGEDWLNNSAAKQAVFEMLRFATQIMPPDGFAFGSVINRYRSTEKLSRLSEPEVHKLLHQSGKSYKQLMAEGWIDPPQDAVIAIIQTPDRICKFNQTYDPKERMFVGQPIVDCGPPEYFSGRLKMFGKEETTN